MSRDVICSGPEVDELEKANDKRPGESLAAAIARFVGSFEAVFRRDWPYTLWCLSPDSVDEFIARGHDFLQPGVLDEANQWGTRAAMLAAYRNLVAHLDGIHRRPLRPSPDRYFVFTWPAATEGEAEAPESDPGDPLTIAAARFVGAAEVVLQEDWKYTLYNLRPDSVDWFVAPGHVFLQPGVSNEQNNWGARAALLQAYRELVAEMERSGLSPTQPAPEDRSVAGWESLRERAAAVHPKTVHQRYLERQSRPSIDVPMSFSGDGVREKPS